MPVYLLIAGVALILLGLLGKIKARDVDVGTENPTVRVAVTALGGVLLIASLAAYIYEVRKADPPLPPNGTPTPSVSNLQNANASPSPTSSTVARRVRIMSPQPGEVSVEQDNKAAIIPVSGVAEGYPAAELADLRVYIFSRTGGVPEWWYENPAEVDARGGWSGRTLSGGGDKRAKTGDKVEVCAVLASESAMKKTTGGKQVLSSLSAFNESIKSEVVSITLIVK